MGDDERGKFRARYLGPDGMGKTTVIYGRTKRRPRGSDSPTDPYLPVNEEGFAQSVRMNSVEDLRKFHDFISTGLHYRLVSQCEERRLTKFEQELNERVNLIHIAAYFDSLECLVYFHRFCRHDIRSQSGNSFTALQYACYGGATECAEYLLVNGANPNEAPDRYKSNPLYLSACSGNVTIMRLLFKHGAVLTDQIRRSSSNPLEQALLGKHIECLELILEKDSSPNMTRVHGTMSPLMHAVSRGIYEAVQLLLDKGVDPNYRNERGSCAMYWALVKNKPDIVDLLISKGTKVDFIFEQQGSNAVHAACEGGNLELVKKMVSMGVPAIFRDHRGRLPTFSTLKIANKDEMIPILRFLIEDCHLDINAKDKEGNTFLSDVLVDKSRMTPALASFLLEHGLNIREPLRNRMTVYDNAMKVCSPEVKKVFSDFANKRPPS